MQYNVEGRKASFLVFVILALMVQRAGCPYEAVIEPSISNTRVEERPPSPCSDQEDPCLRVMRLQPVNRGPETTLFWWSLCLGCGGNILWSLYFMHCRDPHYSVFPIFLTCIIGIIIHAVLAVLTIMRTTAMGDKRLQAGGVVVITCILIGYILRQNHFLGWIALSVALLANLCRIGSVDYHINFNKKNCFGHRSLGESVDCCGWLTLISASQGSSRSHHISLDVCAWGRCSYGVAASWRGGS